MSGSVSESRNNSLRVNKSVRLPDIKNFSHSSGEDPLSEI